MGVLANHVPSIEQLKPGLVEVIEESGGSKQFFRTILQTDSAICITTASTLHNEGMLIEALRSFRRLCNRATRLAAQHQRR